MTTHLLQLDPQRPTWVSHAARVLCQPHTIFLPFLILGFVLWLCPSTDGASGYRIREELSPTNLLVLLLWYACIVVCAAMGQLLARSLPRLAMMSANAFDTELFYKVLSGIAAVGVAAAWWAALRNGISLVELARTQQFNAVKEALYDNYNQLHSLRYTSSLAGGYAMYRLVFTGVFRKIDALNFVGLLAAAAISARLLLIQSVIFAVALAVHSGTISRVRPRTIIFASLGLSVCIVAFTWVRSAGTYREHFGVVNPVAMTFVEFQRYVGGPVQASVGVASISANHPHRGTIANCILYLCPTFLHPESSRKGDNSGGVGEQWYLDQIDVDHTLTTNSAFVEMYGDLGFWAFPVIAWVSFLMAALGSYFFRADNLLCLIGCVVLYAFFELWRTYYFAAGSFTFLIIAVLAAAGFALLMKPVRAAV